jgi:L-ascorbate metabolism protein UlaG (beta-lactamase superfamily)
MRITWWGHATVGITDGGTTILTDPVLSNRLAHLRRRRGPTPQPAAPDAVALSHLHADHCHLPSLRSLPPATRLVVPRGAAGFLRDRLGARRPLTELSPGETTTVGSLTVRAVPADHHPARSPLSGVRAEAVGYVVSGSRSAWFAGDTGLFDEMKAIGPVDLALVPVWGWGWTLGPGHLDPVRAADAVRLVGPAQAVPIHWGTLWPIGCDRIRPDRFQDPGGEFATQVARLAPEVDVRVLAPGESLTVTA